MQCKTMHFFMFLIFISVIVYKMVTSHFLKTIPGTNDCFLALLLSLLAGLAQAVHIWYIWGGGVPLALVFMICCLVKLHFFANPVP